MIGLLVAETIALARVHECAHPERVRLSAEEERCARCGVVATEEGWRNLALLSARYRAARGLRRLGG